MVAEDKKVMVFQAEAKPSRGRSEPARRALCGRTLWFKPTFHLVVLSAHGARREAVRGRQRCDRWQE